MWKSIKRDEAVGLPAVRRQREMQPYEELTTWTKQKQTENCRRKVEETLSKEKKKEDNGLIDTKVECRSRKFKKEKWKKIESDQNNEWIKEEIGEKKVRKNRVDW